MSNFFPITISEVVNKLPNELQNIDLQSYSCSLQRCIDAGVWLIEKIDEAGGLNDELDQRAASYIKASSATVKKINAIRSPLTSCFDEIRKAFTDNEKSISPTQQGTPAFLLQQMRNTFARKKAEAAKQRRRMEQERIQMEIAANTYRIRCASIIADSFTRYLEKFEIGISEKIKTFTNAKCSTSLHETINKAKEKVLTDLSELETTLPAEPLLAQHYKQRIFNEVYTERVPGIKEQILQTIGEIVVHAHARIDEKASLLLQLGKSADAEKKLEALGKQKLTSSENLSIAAKAAQEEKIKMKAAEAENLFAMAEAQKPAEAEYMPKTKSKMVCCPLNAEGFAEVFALWWAGEGKYLSMEELEKQFKKQITYANKVANTEKSEKINSPNVEYRTEIKAR